MLWLSFSAVAISSVYTMLTGFEALGKENVK